MSENAEKKRFMTTKQIVGEVIAVLVAIIIAMMPPPEPLTVQGMWGLGILAWAVINWIFESFADYVVCLIMCSMLVGFKVVSFDIAFKAFAGSTWWMLVAAIAIGVGAYKCGLIKRISLLIMRLFPSSFNGQVVAMLASGAVITPIIPSSLAKTAIAGPIAMGISDTLGFEKRSKGSAGMFLAMYAGYFLGGPVFLSAATFCYMIKGQLPEAVQAQFTWGQWTISTIPYFIVLLVGSYFAITRLYKPQSNTRLPADYIKDQLKELGPMSRHEKITGIVLAIALVLWVLESALGISAVVTTVIAMCVLVIAGVLNVQDLHTKVNWTMLIFIGGIISMSDIMSTLQINVWLRDVLTPYVSGIVANPYLFVATIVVVMVLLRFVVVSVAAAIMLVMAIFTPFAIQAGINPWIVGFVAYTASLVWVMYYQNSGFLMGYAQSGGAERINFNHTVKMGVVYVVICLLGCLVSVPYWQAIGLIA